MKNFLLSLIVLICLSASAFAYPVAFNTKTCKYHKLSCTWAQKCTKNCVKIDHKEAIKLGGKPCKVCGG